MDTDDRDQRTKSLQERLSKLSEASLNITEDLDLDTVLQGVVDGARSLTGAGRGCIIVVDESGQLQAFLTSGVTEEEYRLLLELSVNAGRVPNHVELLERVWGPGHSGTSVPARTATKTLRRKLGDEAENPTYVFNKPRIGYWMERGETPEGERL